MATLDQICRDFYNRDLQLKTLEDYTSITEDPRFREKLIPNTAKEMSTYKLIEAVYAHPLVWNYEICKLMPSNWKVHRAWACVGFSFYRTSHLIMGKKSLKSWWDRIVKSYSEFRFGTHSPGRNEPRPYFASMSFMNGILEDRHMRSLDKSHESDQDSIIDLTDEDVEMGSLDGPFEKKESDDENSVFNQLMNQIGALDGSTPTVSPTFAGGLGNMSLPAESLPLLNTPLSFDFSALDPAFVAAFLSSFNPDNSQPNMFSANAFAGGLPPFGNSSPPLDAQTATPLPTNMNLLPTSSSSSASPASFPLNLLPPYNWSALSIPTPPKSDLGSSSKSSSSTPPAATEPMPILVPTTTTTEIVDDEKKLKSWEHDVEICTKEIRKAFMAMKKDKKKMEKLKKSILLLCWGEKP